MAILRFTPPTVSGPFSSTTEGLYDLSFNWSPQQIPISGDTAIVSYGTLSSIGDTIRGVDLFVISTNGQSNPALSLQDTRLDAGSTLVVDSRALGVSIPITVSFNFENDGTIDIFGQVTLSSFASSATIVNKGAVNLYDGFLITSATVENDGVIMVDNSSPTAFVSPITGTGSIVIKPGSTVETTSSVSSGQTFKFLGAQANSTLQVDSPRPLTRRSQDSPATDKIVLKTNSSTISSISYVASGANSGSLRISTGGITTSVNFIGSYSLSDFTIAGNTGGVVVTTSSTDQSIEDTSPVYRFFDSINGTHLFTQSLSEAQTILTTRPDLTQETNTFGAVSSTSTSAEAVYRFFETTNGTHFFTSSYNEFLGLTTPGTSTYRPDLTYEAEQHVLRGQHPAVGRRRGLSLF